MLRKIAHVSRLTETSTLQSVTKRITFHCFHQKVECLIFMTITSTIHSSPRTVAYFEYCRRIACFIRLMQTRIFQFANSSTYLRHETYGVSFVIRRITLRFLWPWNSIRLDFGLEDKYVLIYSYASFISKAYKKCNFIEITFVKNMV